MVLLVWDGITAADYEADLMANLRSLLERMSPSPSLLGHRRCRSGAYLERTRLEGDPADRGYQRLEDKVLQRAIVMLLQPDLGEDWRLSDLLLVWLLGQGEVSAHQASSGSTSSASMLMNGTGVTGWSIWISKGFF